MILIKISQLYVKINRFLYYKKLHGILSIIDTLKLHTYKSLQNSE